MTETKLTLPTIHLNGTSAEALMEGYQKAYEAVSDSILVVARAYPNGRDYYPQGNEALPAALLEHDRRLMLLNVVAKELETLIVGISDLESAYHRR